MGSYFFSKFEQHTLDSILDLVLSFGQAVSGSLLLEGESGLVLVAGRNLRSSYFGPRDQGTKRISEMVFETGKPLLIDETNIPLSKVRRRRAERYSLSFPIRNGTGKTVGVLNLNRVEKPFQTEEVSVIEKLSLVIALLVEENILRRNRERLLIVFSEIVNLFSERGCLQEKDVFEKVFSSIKLLLGIDRGVVFKLSPQRPYMVFTHRWPKRLSLSRINLERERYCEERKISVVKGSWRGEEQLFLIVPMWSTLGERSISSIPYSFPLLLVWESHS